MAGEATDDRRDPAGVRRGDRLLLGSKLDSWAIGSGVIGRTGPAGSRVYVVDSGRSTTTHPVGEECWCPAAHVVEIATGTVGAGGTRTGAGVHTYGVDTGFSREELTPDGAVRLYLTGEADRGHVQVYLADTGLTDQQLRSRQTWISDVGLDAADTHVFVIDTGFTDASGATYDVISGIDPHGRVTWVIDTGIR